MPRESLPAKKKRAKFILKALHKKYPGAECSLDFNNPLQLLVATILSAQCTDARVNKVTPRLFKKYKTVKAFAQSPQGELEEKIRSTGFFNNKAKSIRGACRAIHEKHGDKVPRTMEELLDLPGVARKTANVVLGTAYGKAEGVVVDTHVKRVTGLLKLTSQKDPQKIEKDLIKILPQKDWIYFTHAIIELGREICIARRPRCEVCCLLPYCPYGKKNVGSTQRRTRVNQG